MLITALHSGQLPPSSTTRRAQFSQNLACPQGTKAKPSIGANRHTSQHRNGVSAAAGAPGTDAAADALAAVGVNCSASSSSSELSACWLGSFHRCSTVYSPPSLTETTCLLLTYVLNLGVNAVDHTVPSNNTGLTLNAYVCSCSTPVYTSFSSPSFSRPANSSPANSAIPLRDDQVLIVNGLFL